MRKGCQQRTLGMQKLLRLEGQEVEGNISGAGQTAWGLWLGDRNGAEGQ